MMKALIALWLLATIAAVIFGLNMGASILPALIAFFGGLGTVLWYLPVHIALSHGHRYTSFICVITLFFGWTLLGWFVALAWAGQREQWAEHGGYAGPIKSYNMFT